MSCSSEPGIGLLMQAVPGHDAKVLLNDSILPFLNECRPCLAGKNGGPDFGIMCFWDFAAVRSSA